MLFFDKILLSNADLELKSDFFKANILQIKFYYYSIQFIIKNLIGSFKYLRYQNLSTKILKFNNCKSKQYLQKNQILFTYSSKNDPNLTLEIMTQNQTYYISSIQTKERYF